MAISTSFYAVAVIVLTSMYSVYGQPGAFTTLQPCVSSFNGHYRCNDGNGCYWDHDRCNFYAQCSDKSDDMNCDGCQDSDSFFCARSRQCVGAYEVCNRVYDCSNGEDEDLPECHPTIWMYWTGGQMAGIVIGYVIFLVIVIAIVIVVHKKCKK